MTRQFQMPMSTWLRYVHPLLDFAAGAAPDVTLQIELKAEDLYDKEKVDLETIVLDDVFQLLQCDDQGLTQEEVTRRIELFGLNKLESEEQNVFFQVCILQPFLSPRADPPRSSSVSYGTTCPG